MRRALPSDSLAVGFHGLPYHRRALRKLTRPRFSRQHPGAVEPKSAIATAGTVLAFTGLVDGQAPKLLDRVRQAIRVRHYSRRTEEAYVYWIRRYIVFHGKAHPATLGAADLSAFLSWLAEHQHVSASTQNQALSAVLFLYRNVLAIEIDEVPPVVRARTPERLPVVLGRDEVSALLKPLSGTMRLVVTLLYGGGGNRSVSSFG